MALRVVLSLIGIVIIALVVFHALDTMRLQRRRREAAAVQSNPPASATSVAEPVVGVDFEPSATAVKAKRALAADAAVDVATRVQRDPMREEIETLEEVATMPLNLNPGLPGTPRHADLGRPAVPDDKIDFIIGLLAGVPVLRDQALGVYKQDEYVLEKPHRLYGCRVDSDLWSELQHDSQRTRYGDLAFAIQLVDANGPIDDSELHKFSQVGLRLADALERRTQFSASFEDAAARASELHAFCQTFDVIAAVHVVSSEGDMIKGRRLEHAARKLGMQWGARRLFHMKNEFSPGSHHLFSLANLSKSGELPAAQWEKFETAGVTLFMTVPCAHRPAAVFDKMVTAAQTLAETLGAQVQDQERRPLGKQGIAVIRHQIEEIEEKMRTRGIAAGSRTALRLFADDAVD